MSRSSEDSSVEKRPVLSRIPVFPPIALSVLDSTSRSNVEIAHLAELIGSDAVFSAQVLRLANSPVFGHAAQIESLRHALVTLGLERLQGLAMTVATSNYLKAAMRIEELRRCWRHTLACAILCRELAQAASLPGELGYTLGLMHDIGRLGLLAAYPDPYAEMLREADRDPQSLLDLEHKRFGMDHCEVGRVLAEQWNLPENFPLILGRHHDRPSGNGLDLLGVVYHGCRLADTLGFSVLKPLRPATVEQIQAELPSKIAARFREVIGDLAELVEQRIKLHDSGEAAAPILPGCAAAFQEDEDSVEAAPAEPETTTEGAAPPGLFGFLRASPRVWDSLVVATAAAVITAVLAVGFYWFNR